MRAMETVLPIRALMILPMRGRVVVMVALPGDSVAEPLLVALLVSGVPSASLPVPLRLSLFTLATTSQGLEFAEF